MKDITLIFRGPRKVKNFDLPLPWFGDDRWDKRREFESASWPERLRALKEERDGGSLTPELDAKIRALETKGVCVVREYTEVRAASWIDHNNADPNPHPDERGDCTVGGDGGGGHFEICLDDDTGLRVERIWLATGSLSGVEDDLAVRTSPRQASRGRQKRLSGADAHSSLVKERPFVSDGRTGSYAAGTRRCEPRRRASGRSSDLRRG